MICILRFQVFDNNHWSGDRKLLDGNTESFNKTVACLRFETGSYIIVMCQTVHIEKADCVYMRA